MTERVELHSIDLEGSFINFWFCCCKLAAVSRRSSEVDDD